MHKIQRFFQNWKRRSVQAASLILIGEWSFYGIFRCPFAVPYISCGSCPVIQCPGRSLWMWSWIIIGISAVFMGRVFCGWACPGGFLAEILAIGSFLKNTVRGVFHKVLNYGKYIVLIVSLCYFFIFNNPRWAVPIRTGEFFKSVGLTFEHADPVWIYKTAAILGLFAIGLVIPRFWCRYLCPTGGALELISKLSLFRYSMSAGCTDCDQCRSVCPTETRPAEASCLNCGDCVPSCKPEAICVMPVTSCIKGDTEADVIT